jgi:hypothetical protein
MEEGPEPWTFEEDRPRHLADVADKDPCRGKVRRKIAILVQAGPDESMKKDVDRMKQALGRIGFIGWTIRYKRGKRLSSVRNFLARYLATAPDAPGPCDKLLLYISGHGKDGFVIWGPKETPKGAGSDNYWWYKPSFDFD